MSHWTEIETKAHRGESRPIPDSFSSWRNSVTNRMRPTLGYSSSPLPHKPSSTWGISISAAKFITLQTNVHTSSLVLVCLDICFSNSFLAAAMSVTAPLFPASSVTQGCIQTFPSRESRVQAQFPITKPRQESTGNTGAIPPSSESNTQSFQSC